MNRTLIVLMVGFGVALAAFVMLGVRVVGAADTQPPVVYGVYAYQRGNGSNFLVEAEAADDIGIVREDIYLDGVYVGTPTQNGYPVLVRIKGQWEHLVEAHVYDAAGNAAFGGAWVWGSK